MLAMFSLKFWDKWHKCFGTHKIADSVNSWTSVLCKNSNSAFVFAAFLNPPSVLSFLFFHHNCCSCQLH